MDDIAVGSEHTLALTSDGEIWAWGSNGDGQLGLGHTGAVREPQMITNLTGKSIKQVGTVILSSVSIRLVRAYSQFVRGSTVI